MTDMGDTGVRAHDERRRTADKANVAPLGPRIRFQIERRLPPVTRAIIPRPNRSFVQLGSATMLRCRGVLLTPRPVNVEYM